MTAPPLRLQPAGPPRLWRGPHACVPATRKGLALVLVAGLDPGCPRARAAELLWPGVDPAAARRNLRRELFRLREQGLAPAVDADATGRGLQLAVQLEWPAPAALVPRWLDGLDGVAGDAWAGWLDEQRARLQAGWVDHLVAQARDAERRHDPDAWRAWRAVLADAAGGPGHPEARAAAQRLVPPEPVAPARVAPGGGQAVGPLPFVGREAERQAIADSLQRVGLVLLDGAPGVGKTRLALEALAGQGGVLLLRCRPEDLAVPYASALRGLQALREAAPGIEPAAWARRTLAPLVPAWAGHPAAATGPAEPADERLRHAWRAAVRTLAQGNFGALVVDDWQWADPASLALLDPGPEPPPLPTLVLHRSGELPAAALAQRRRWLDGGRAHAVRVPPLADADAAQLLRQAGATAAEAGRIGPRAAGNPLFLLETLRHMRGQGGDAVLPESVHDVVVARVRALGAATRRVLEAAAVADDDWRSAELAAAAGLDDVTVAQALEHAVAAELLAADAQGRHRYAHDLLAQGVADSLTTVRLRALHAQWAAALHARGAEPGRIARHLQRADRGSESAAWHVRAAEVARRRRAWPAMAAAAAAALQHGDEAHLRLSAHLLAAEAARLQGHLEGAEAALAEALADAVQAGPASVVELDLARAELLAHTGRAEAALAVLDALATDPALQPPQRQRLQHERAAALGFLGRHRESLALLRQALDSLPPSQAALRMRLLNLASRAAYWAGELDAARTLNAAMQALATSLGDGASAAAALYRAGVLDREHGQLDAAATQLAAAVVAARGAGALELLRSALSTLATVRMDQMRLDEAQALLAEGEQAAPFWDSPLVEDVYDERRLRLHTLRGEVDAAWAVWRRSLQRLQRLDHRHFLSATLLVGVRLALLTDDVSGARAHLRAAGALYADAADDGLHARELAVHDACVRQAEGDAAGALQVAADWLAQPHERRNEERARVHIAAAAAALDLGDPAAAARHVQAVRSLPPLPAELQAGLLAVQLRLARAGGTAAADAERAAHAWLAQPAVPALEAARLRRALAQRPARGRPHLRR